MAGSVQGVVVQGIDQGADLLGGEDVLDLLAQGVHVRAGLDQVVLPERTDALLHSLRDKAVQVQAFAQANHSTIFRANGFWSAIEQFVDGHQKEA